jgi:general stress protein YciG
VDGTRKERRGFASMSREKQREIASKGGRAAHEKGTAHEWTPDEARAAAVRVDRAAAEDAGDLCQFLLPRCIIYKWRLAPAGSLAARTNYLARARRLSSPE